MAVSQWIRPVILEGKHVKLAQLSHVYSLDLQAAIGDQHKIWYTLVPEPQNLTQEISRRLELQAKQSMLPFVVIKLPENTAVGMTTYMNIDAPNRKLEIGYTWYAKSVQRTGANTEAKLMMLKHAFEDLNCIAVEFRTHRLNQQSRKAIERLGAKLDGILRNDRIMLNGTIRDTCVYSIINSE